MSYTDFSSLSEVLGDLPPEMATLIRGVLMASEQREAGMTAGEMFANSIEQKFRISETLFSPFVIICVLLCIIVFFGIKFYAEYKVSQLPKLQNKDYSPLGKYILSYCHNYEKINAGTMKDDIDKIYDRCLFKYEQQELLEQRQREIIIDRKKSKIKNYISIMLFITLFLFFFLIGIGGFYIGYEFKGILLMSVVTFIGHKIIPFIFPYRTDSYECLQVQEFRNIIENYELEKIQKLL